MNKAFTANCLGKDNKSWAVYFMVDHIEDAENIIEQLGIVTDEAGVCEMVEVLDAEIN